MHSFMLSRPGRSYIKSSMHCSIIALKPRAPVLRLMASAAIARSAPSVHVLNPWFLFASYGCCSELESAILFANSLEMIVRLVAKPSIVGALLWNWEEGALEAVEGLQW